MKKSISYVVSTLLMILCLSFGINFIIDTIQGGEQRKAYSMSTCLNEQVTENMSRTDIAKMYKDACVKVNVSAVIGTNYDGSRWGLSSSGSGVCVAANGFVVNEDYSASKGSYFLTNYHVIALLVEEDFKKNTISYSLSVTLDRDETQYECTLLWSNEAVDMAIIYCDESLDIGWISMQDRSVACQDEEKLVFDEIFTIGTPLGEFKNTLSLGYVSNTDLDMEMQTAEAVYSYSVPSGVATKKSVYTTNPYVENDEYLVKTNVVLSNYYENIFMMNCDITNGNSGGGVFDDKGKLIGLATLGVDHGSAGTAALNFGIPIYPAIFALKDVILKNEGASDVKIVDISTLGISVIDLNERNAILNMLRLDIKNDQDRYDKKGIYHGYVGIDAMKYIYVNGTLYTKASIGDVLASFGEEGVMVLSSLKNSSGQDLFETGFIIKSISGDDNQSVTIKERNDLIYFLLQNKSTNIKIVGRCSGDNVDTTYRITL